MNSELSAPVPGTPALDEILELAERAQLVEPQPDPDAAYNFKHTLVQEMVYKTLLKSDRRALHEETARALEKLYPEQLDENAAVLAFHFEQAEDDQRAIHYSIRAGDRAAEVYADAEALAAYSRAINIGEECGTVTPLPYARRGQLYERAGKFEAANADLEKALGLARAQRDSKMEWECLSNLGALWAARDYNRTGEYYEQALAIATAGGDKAMFAHSLNRVGNWYMNSEKITPAFELYERALGIFQELEDKPGIAESYDSLGMCSFFEGDTFLGAQYYKRAIALWRELDDLRGLASSQTAYAFLHRNYDTDMIFTEYSFEESMPMLQNALRWAQEISWRAGESFTSSQIGISYASQGEYTLALEYAERSLTIAEEIQHNQWIVSALYAVGSIHTELLDAEYAETHLARALKIARAVNSVYWTRMMQGWLAISLVGQRKLDEAHRVLEPALQDETAMQTVSQRRLWSARILLALAEGDAARALDWTEKMIKTARYADMQVIPMLGYMQARSLAQLERFDSAESVIRGAIAQAEKENLRPMLWRLYSELTAILHAQGQAQQAGAAADAARGEIHTLAQGLSEETPDLLTGTTRPLRTLFATRALERLERIRAAK